MRAKHWLMWPAVVGLGVGCGGTVTEEPREEAQASQALACESVSLIQDINPSGHASPSKLTAGNGVFFFTATNGSAGTELWKSDGTAAGTVMVKDINPGAGNGTDSSANMAFRNGTLFFAASNGKAGTELWKSDGTAAGTVMVKDIYTGSSSSAPANLTFVGSTLFFTANNGSNGTELWKSDGTAAGTVMVKDIYKKGGASGNASVVEIHEFNGLLIFVVDDGSSGYELWKSDGTSAGTAMVKDINPGNTSSGPDHLWVTSTQVFFVADDGVHGDELWRTDGTAAGTVLVKDIYPGPTTSLENWLWGVGQSVYLAANDGVHGLELWKSDGTAAGTVMVKDITPGPNSTPFGYYPHGAWDDGTFLFSGGLYDLWKSDGTAAGTSFVANMAQGRPIICPWWCPPPFQFFHVLNGTYYIVATDGLTGYELWKTDGTTAGTAQAADIYPGRGSSMEYYPSSVKFNGSIYFSASGPQGMELWGVTPTPCP
jgi:ELWxxDGT repeat protein